MKNKINVSGNSKKLRQLQLHSKNLTLLQLHTIKVIVIVIVIEKKLLQLPYYRSLIVVDSVSFQLPITQLPISAHTQRPTHCAFCNSLICTLTSSTSRVPLQSVASHSAAATPAHWAPFKSRSVHFCEGMRRRIAPNWRVIGATTEIVIYLCGLLKTCSSISLIMRRWHFIWNKKNISDKKLSPLNVQNSNLRITIKYSCAEI